MIIIRASPVARESPHTPHTSYRPPSPPLPTPRAAWLQKPEVKLDSPPPYLLYYLEHFQISASGLQNPVPTELGRYLTKLTVLRVHPSPTGK